MCFEFNLAQLRLEMTACNQMEGLSVLGHGDMVWDRYRELVAHLRDGAPLQTEWRLPDWISDPKVLERLLDDHVMELYTTYHDCGKPRCLQVDQDGKRHFPDHAAMSRQTWLDVGGTQEVAELIGLDMEVHLLKDAGVAEFAKRSQAIALLLTALSEIHANASMFGGVDSTSFKIKWKQVDKRGRATIKAMV